MRQPTKQFYEFGPFRLDPVERLLYRDGEVVTLSIKELREREGCCARSRRHPLMRFAQKFRIRRRVTRKTGFFRYLCPLLLRRQ